MKHCGDTYACGSGSNGTTNMNTHIEKRYKKYRPPSNDSRQTFLVKQPNVESSGSTLATSRFSVEEYRRALAEMLILDELPFRFVENRGFLSDGLKNLHESVVAIRNAVKYVKSSPSRLAQIKKCVEHEKMGNNGFVLLDVPTQWNSTYLMLESALKLRKAIERMEEEDGHYINYFRESDNEKKRIRPPLLNDWENDKYWGSLDETNNLLIIAVVLDPRYKLAYVKWRFDAFFGVQQSQLMLSSLKDVLVDLYECYVKLYSGVGVKSNDGVSSSGSGVPETFCEKEKFREDSLWGQKQQEEDVSMGKSEVELYLLEACEKLNDKFDLLVWWKNSSIKFPIFSMIVKDVFSMPISTVASESALSTGRRILDPFRSSLTPKIVDGLILTGNWLSTSCPIAELCVAEEHAKNDNNSVQMLEHYTIVETGK
ncbi:hypothetical protein Ddye_015929 [Dipteronia dyeriana]|uniref:HAT C-terminal dimerisation domain-containing protein n=1 Tax=Dipteronia dyeriana TaxID=168575 RepID=A0AAD9U5R5_9ROSI|nr:hypothetical protein Ddye_015929 [Dipteronia dyeriana]